MSVEIVNRQRLLRVPRKRIQRIVDDVLAERGAADALVSVAIVDNREIRRLNRRFLGRDAVTDVIAFANDDPTPDGLLGDVAVSAEKAAREARRRGVSPQGELLLYVVHGVLHLLGMDDASQADAQRMHEAALAALRLHGVKGVA